MCNGGNSDAGDEDDDDADYNDGGLNSFFISPFKRSNLHKLSGVSPTVFMQSSDTLKIV